MAMNVLEKYAFFLAINYSRSHLALQANDGVIYLNYSRSHLALQANDGVIYRISWNFSEREYLVNFSLEAN